MVHSGQQARVQWPHGTLCSADPAIIISARVRRWINLGMRAAAVADIFVSYTSSDRHWAHWIAKELEALGHVVHVHEWETTGGNDIYARMERQHDAADHVLCAVSDEYLGAPYSTLERNAALWQAAGKRPGFVLLVAAKLCRFPTLGNHVRRCELYGIPEDAARLRFHDFMTKRAVSDAVAFPGKVVAVSNVPTQVPTHRMGGMTPLPPSRRYSRYEGWSPSRPCTACAEGKTTLAAAYAERHRGDYRATWWIRAQTEPTSRVGRSAWNLSEFATQRHLSPASSQLSPFAKRLSASRTAL